MKRLAVCGLLIAACGSTSYSEAEGSQGAPCYANGTCNVGLQCGQGRCLAVGDGGSSGAPAGDGDGSTAPACRPPDESSFIVCENAQGSMIQCVTGTKCCVDEGTCVVDSVACGPSSRVLDCLSTSQCRSDRCCLGAQLVDASACPATMSAFSGTRCAASCDAGELTLCTRSTECAGGRQCRGVAVEIDFGSNGSVQTVRMGACL